MREKTKFRPQTYGYFGQDKKISIAEFEDADWLGSTTIWSSGEVEAESILINNEDVYFNIRRIVDNIGELNEFLNDVYDYHFENYDYAK